MFCYPVLANYSTGLCNNLYYRDTHLNLKQLLGIYDHNAAAKNNDVFNLARSKIKLRDKTSVCVLVSTIKANSFTWAHLSRTITETLWTGLQNSYYLYYYIYLIFNSPSLFIYLPWDALRAFCNCLNKSFKPFNPTQLNWVRFAWLSIH